MKIDLNVCSDWLVQGQIIAENRFFWYRCRSGSQSLAEMTGPMGLEDSDWLPGREICFCEASGLQHVYPDDGTPKLCEPIFSKDVARHTAIAEACVKFLLLLPKLP